jgi:hypothetical protein
MSRLNRLRGRSKGTGNDKLDNLEDGMGREDGIEE